ncbi:MAG: SPFH/Band 7/PHB domain protein [Elusimicrobia bacterium]|nr:SPFH/Band 7/PHB domain protein [Elusimicrobiota bacterium]
MWMVGGFVIFYFFKCIRIVQQYEKGLVETLGKYSATVDPGLTFIFPPFQFLRRVDTREQVIDVPHQEVITKDNAQVTVDAVIYFQINDPFKVVYNISNFALAATKLAQTNLRNIIGSMQLDETLTSREKINTHLREVLESVTDRWGVHVARVEIQKIEPPRDITDSMSKQMKAEREKRAAILDAEGFKQAAILRSEGEKQSAILKAEGGKEAAILDAEGKAAAVAKMADAERYQVETVFSAIHAGHPTKELIAIKYLEALPKIAQGNATKIFLPIEASAVLGALGGMTDFLKKDASETPAQN